MFALINPPQIVPVKIVKSKSSHRIYPQHTNKSEDLLTLNIDLILENEKQYNKTETWNKLDKTFKMQKLTLFAEKFISENPNIDTTVDSVRVRFRVRVRVRVRVSSLTSNMANMANMGIKPF
jgi:hypothetical protein